MLPGVLLVGDGVAEGVAVLGSPTGAPVADVEVRQAVAWAYVGSWAETTPVHTIITRRLTRVYTISAGKLT